MRREIPFVSHFYISCRRCNIGTVLTRGSREWPQKITRSFLRIYTQWNIDLILLLSPREENTNGIIRFFNFLQVPLHLTIHYQFKQKIILTAEI